MAANFWRAVWAWLISFGMAMIISMFTKPKSDEQLHGLVWGLTKKSHAEQQVPWLRTPEFWATIAFVIFILLNLYCW